MYYGIQTFRAVGNFNITGISISKEPLFIKALAYLEKAIHTLIDKCIVGITANEEHCYKMVMNSIGIVTQLNPILGYEECASIAREGLQTGKKCTRYCGKRM